MNSATLGEQQLNATIMIGYYPCPSSELHFFESFIKCLIRNMFVLPDENKSLKVAETTNFVKKLGLLTRIIRNIRSRL